MGLHIWPRVQDAKPRSRVDPKSGAGHVCSSRLKSVLDAR